MTEINQPLKQPGKGNDNKNEPKGKISEDIKATILRTWFGITAKFLQKIPSLKRIVWLVACIGLLLGVVFIIHAYYDQIVVYLIGRNIDSEGNFTSFFPSLFMTLGASVLTVLAITFSLSLFSIQQAADKHTPTVLRKFLKDKVNKCIFGVIASISLIFFIFALLPINRLLFYEVILGFFFIILIFYLLRKQYAHITNLINPLYQTIFYHNNGIKLLNKIDRHLDLLINAKIIRPGTENNVRKVSKEEQRDQLRAGLILRLPDLFDGVKSCLNQIYALIQTYQKRKDYQVTQGGFNTVHSLVHKYIDVRNGAFFPSSMIPALDYSRDDFLIDVFEKFTAIQRTASIEKDLPISRQILDCFSQIAIKCTEIRYRANVMNEYTHCMLATGYMEQNTEESLNAGLLDIGIQGSDRLRDIGLVLVNKGAQTNISMILEHLSKIAMHGLLRPNASYLIASPVKAYSILLRAVLYNRNIDHQILPKTILDKVQQIICLYVKIKDSNIISMEMEFSIGDFVDLSKQTALPYIFDEVYDKIQDAKTPAPDRDYLIKSIMEFGHEVWHFYDELSKSAAEKESFLIHFIDSNLERITMVLLRFYQLDIPDEKEKKEILNDIGWIMSNYWRIYHYHKKITKNYQHQILEHLLRIGSEFNRLSLVESLNEVIDTVIPIANSFLEKQKNSLGFDPIRIVERAVYLCILNSSDQVYTNFLKQIKDKFWSEYCRKYPHHKDLLFNELLKIDPVHIKLNSPRLSFEDELLSQLNKDSITKFVDRLRKDLK